MKRYFLIIGLIFIFIIVAIVVATNMQSNDTNDEFFAYVKDNSLILWNERNNEKIVLNSNFDSSKEMFLDIHFAYSFDKTKIIYPYNISDNSVGLRYVDINNISEENSQLIDDGVLLYEIVKNGLVYIKDMNLYHYDFNDKQMIAENITAYAVSNDKNTLYYLLENGDAYQISLDSLEKNKILSGIDGINVYGDIVLSYIKENNLFSLYVDDELISDKVVNILGEEDNVLYFTKYEGKLTNFETSEDLIDLNSNVATYRYKDGNVTRLGDGILNLVNDFTNANTDEYLVLGKYNGTNFDISFYNQKEDYVFSLGSTDKYNIYGYDDATKTVYYQGADDLFYQATLSDKKLENIRLIGENIAIITKENNNIYYIENNTSNLYLLQDEENVLIAENIKDWFIIDNILYYIKNNEDKLSLNCYQCNMQEITNIDSFSNINDQIFYFADTYLKDDVLHGNLYTVINGVNVLVDDDVIVSYGVIHLNY